MLQWGECSKFLLSYYYLLLQTYIFTYYHITLRKTYFLYSNSASCKRISLSDLSAVTHFTDPITTG